MALVYEEFTKILRRCFFDVQNEVGLGRREQGYHDACLIWLQENSVPIQSKEAHHLRLDGQIAHSLYPDLVAWDAITIELKAVARKLATSEFVQLFDYLKCRADRLGLLVNMGLDRVHVERVVYEPPQYQLKEDWRYWNGRISGNVRDVGAAVQENVEKHNFSVVREYCGHGIGEVFHEDPQVLHYGKRNTGLELRAGMALTVEPMINAGKANVKLLPDGWTVVTKDHSLSAQWEHTCLITASGVEVLTLGADSRRGS